MLNSGRVNLIEVSEDCWEAWVSGQEDQRYQGGDSPLVAICRAVVASQLGDTVMLPEALLDAETPAIKSPAQA